MLHKDTSQVEPVNIDASFQYRCPKCDISHWCYLREVTTEGFIIVCYCGSKIIPKTIQDISIIYQALSNKTTTVDDTKKNTENEIKSIPDSILQSCLKSIQPLGYTQKESIELIKKAYSKNPTDNVADLIKLSLLENIND
jgi:hypothetical protein